MFVGHGGAVAEGGMQPRRVVPAFDEAEAGNLRLGLRRKAAAFQQLAFKGREEAFAHRVVVGVPTDPIDGRTPASLQRLPNASDVYWLPWSL